jgi:hypothetical protein
LHNSSLSLFLFFCSFTFIPFHPPYLLNPSSFRFFPLPPFSLPTSPPSPPSPNTHSLPVPVPDNQSNSSYYCQKRRAASRRRSRTSMSMARASGSCVWVA